MFNVSRLSKFVLPVLLISLMMSSVNAQQNTTADELLTCAQQNLNSENFHGVIKVDTFRPEFSRSFLLEIWSTADNENALVRILEPLDEEGSGYLLIGEDELLFFTPLAGQAISLPRAALSESLFGSDVAVEDLYRGTLNERYVPELLGTRNDDNGDFVHRLRLTPKPDADVVFGKLEIDMQDSNCAVLSIDYFDQRDTLVRQGIFEDFVERGGLVFAQRSVVTDLLRQNSFTEQTVQSFEVGIEFPETLFTVDCLEDETQCGLP